MEKNKYPIGGYAPGTYMCTCCTCKTEFFGDKRAVQCEPCGTNSQEHINKVISDLKNIENDRKTD